MKEKIAVLDAISKMDSDLQEKREKVLWKEIDVPFTLNEGLNKYTKDDLTDIRRYLDLKNASSLRKAELIELLEEQIPKLLALICLKFDARLFDLLIKTARNNGYINAPDLEPQQINYLRESGLIYTGTFQGERIIALPDELIEVLLVLEKDAEMKSIISRNTEWVKLTNGLLYYYGTLEASNLYRMIEKYSKEPFDMMEYSTVIYNANDYYHEFTIKNGDFSHYQVQDPEQVKQEQQKRERVPFYSFTKNQLLKAGEPDFVEKNKSYSQLVNHLTGQHYVSRIEAEQIVDKCVYTTKNGGGTSQILRYFTGVVKFEHAESVNPLMERITNLMNNTREWFLKGHTSEELFQQEREALRPLPETKSNPAKMKSKKKIGRNDPCPCGSGKKYKKCCGR